MHRSRIDLTFVLMHVITGTASVLALIERMPSPKSKFWRATRQRFIWHERDLKESGRIRSHLNAEPEVIVDQARDFASFAT